MKHILFLLAFALWLGNASAQRLSDSYWHQGYILTDADERLEGRLKYDLETEVVQLDMKVFVKTYSARNLKMFEFSDARYKIQRRFLVLPFTKNPNSDYESPTFFELVQEGPKLTLLSREKLVVQTAMNPNPWAISPVMTYNQIQYDFFFLYPNGRILYFKGNRGDLARVLNDSDGRIQKFIKKNRLRTDNKGDLAKIVQYYNATN